MRARVIAIAILAFGSTTPIATVHAEGMRCGSKLVSIGDTRAAVRNKCGDPVDVTHKTIVRRPSFVFHGRLYYGDEMAVEAEDWTYNFGPNKFMRLVHFVDGIVEDIDSLDYGYHER